jgi:hypothetical protein
VPDRLYFTESDDANALIASDPMALLVGFALDQQVTVQKAFSGPLALRERVGTLDPAELASADLETVFRAKPAIHRFPASMARGEDADALRANLNALPGFGEMKVTSLASVLAKRFGVRSAASLVPARPTLGDVDSPQALIDYQSTKRAHKAESARMRAARPPAG